MPTVDPQYAALRDNLVGQVLRGSAGVNYYLRERIGEGGQGWVFKANWDEPQGLVVIVKVLRPDAVTGEALTRFQREADVLRLLSQQPRPNPHIVRFFDHAIAQFRPPGTNELLALPFTVLEYVHGSTLEQVLQPLRGRGMPVERVRRIARQVVHALELVHAQKVVHRDLKPSNILLATEQGTEIAKVTDFGIVKMFEINMRRTKTLAGASLGYAPPEQFEQGNQRVTPRTDVFSLAAIVFEMLAGSPAYPFGDHDNPLLIVARIMTDPPPSLARLRPQLTRELRDRMDLIEHIDAVFHRALRAEPTDRHDSVTEFWTQLEPLLRTAADVAASAAPDFDIALASTDLSRTRPSVGIIQPTQLTGLPAQDTAVRIRQGSSPAIGGPRLRPAENAANPAAWTWRVVARAIKAGLLRASTFSPDGETARGAGPTGLARWERGTWAGVAGPPTLDPRTVRGLRLSRAGELVLFGELGLVARIGPRGTFDVWSLADRDLTFRAAYVDENDMITLVGERAVRRSASTSPESVGCVAQMQSGKLAFVADATAANRLNGVTRLTNGQLVACGDWGTIARIEDSVVEHVGPICHGHLAAIEAVDDGGAVTVGAGGHALYISQRLEASLEAVQTTRDLVSLAIGADGAAWAGAAQARLMRRSSESWVRMNSDLGISPAVIALWASDRLVRAVCDDGAVLEGRLS